MTGMAEYEQTRRRIQSEYDRLQAERRYLATHLTRFEEVCNRVPPDFRPDPRLATRIKEVVEKVQEKVQGFLSDVAFPWFALQDSYRWTDISHAATRTSNMLNAMAAHANDVDTWRSGVPMNLVAGRAYPNRGGGNQFPWSGVAGDNYRFSIQAQIKAADRISLIAIRVAGATNSAAVNVATLYLALLILIIACILAIKLIIAALAALTQALAWIGAAIAWGMTVGVVAGFLRSGYRALLQLAEKIWAALVTFAATWFIVEWAVSQQRLVIANLLVEEIPGNDGQSIAFRPTGRWPNPTGDEEFPRMAQDANGQWRVVTVREFR